MDLNKLVPWNWFRNEEEESGTSVPVNHLGQNKLYRNLGRLHKDMDQLFDNFFSGLGYNSFRIGNYSFNPMADGIIRPTLDIRSGDNEYIISIEIPGVEEKNIKLEIAGNALTVSGEKKQEKEDNGKSYYRMERSYGSFKRVLSLPDDADQEHLRATFKNGVLKINMQKKALPKPVVKRVEIK